MSSSQSATLKILIFIYTVRQENLNSLFIHIIFTSFSICTFLTNKIIYHDNLMHRSIKAFQQGWCKMGRKQDIIC